MTLKKLTLILATVYSATAYGQIPEIKGDFGTSIYFTGTKLSISSDGTFTLKKAYALEISGTWTRQESTLILVPTRSLYYSISYEIWRERKDPSEGFHYGKIKIVSADRLFVENTEIHEHFNRLPTKKDGPHKIHFPVQKIAVPDSRDSVAIREILTYIEHWSYDHPYTIELSAQTSKEDDVLDKYIGLKRCRSIVRYFQEQIGIGWIKFTIKDVDFGDQLGESFVELRIRHDYD